MLAATTQQSQMKKSVSWKGVFVREYNCTVGDHPMCSDNLPLSLDWSHSDDVMKTMDSCRERKANYVFPRRLSYENRMMRIFGDDDQQEEAETDTEEQWSNEPSALDEANQGTHASMINIDEALAHDEIEVDATQGVIYCRHLHDEAEDDDDDEDDENYFLDWRKF